MKIIGRMDARAIREINPSWPEFKDVIVGDTIAGDSIEIRGRLNAVWINGEFVGCITRDRNLVGLRLELSDDEAERHDSDIGHAMSDEAENCPICQAREKGGRS